MGFSNHHNYWRIAMADQIISQQKLKEIFDYKDGNLYWKKSRQRGNAGTKAGSLNVDGYIHIKVDKKRYRGHRLIFFYHYGYFPVEVDHINGIRNDNRIENLREATKSQNAHNKQKQINNKSGVKGVYWRKDANKWAVQIGLNGKKYHFGHYKDFKEACFIALQKRYELHKSYAKAL